MNDSISVEFGESSMSFEKDITDSIIAFKISPTSVVFEDFFVTEPISFEIDVPDASFDVGEVSSLEFEFSVGFIGGTGGGVYTGPYEVTPQLYEIINLPTKGVTPKENILVLKIPQYEVSNEAGGTTLILGGE